MFYMIWCEGNRAPTVKHETRHAAITEADRLARVNPGKTFYVLAAIEECTAAVVTTTTRIIYEREQDA